MRKYLHTPVRETSTMVEHIKVRQAEGEQLDFKAKPWTDNLELCKDVAAFANHLGGDIIIGVNDKGDCADGWCPILDIEISKIISNIQQGLIIHLCPRTIAQSVEISSFPQPNVGHSFLVVSIPPSIDLVAVEEKNSDKIQYKFPIRNGRRNQCLIYEEIMTRISTVARAAYITLETLANKKDNVHFSNPVLYEEHTFTYNLITQSKIHGQLETYSKDVVTILMQRQFCYDKRTGYSTQQSTIEIGDNLLTFPLGLIKAVWRDTPTSPILRIALDAKITAYSNAWTIVYD